MCHMRKNSCSGNFPALTRKRIIGVAIALLLVTCAIQLAWATRIEHLLTSTWDTPRVQDHESHVRSQLKNLGAKIVEDEVLGEKCLTVYLNRSWKGGDAGLLLFHDLDNLCQLYLGDSNVTDAAANHLAQITTLRFVDTSDSDLSMRAVALLREARPDLTVFGRDSREARRIHLEPLRMEPTDSTENTGREPDKNTDPSRKTESAEAPFGSVI